MSSGTDRRPSSPHRWGGAAPFPRYKPALHTLGGRDLYVCVRLHTGSLQPKVLRLQATPYEADKLNNSPATTLNAPVWHRHAAAICHVTEAELQPAHLTQVPRQIRPEVPRYKYLAPASSCSSVSRARQPISWLQGRALPPSAAP
eukprot:GHVU01161637.1.p1 GENE.GHVU01161637.1~~GHVU01161637.1.p1  ORF type:complete len:145 (-),score=0.38 GHVU01161637.1:8-442(-)